MAVLHGLTVAVAWATVIYRAPGARRSRPALFVWFTTLTIAVTVTLDFPQVGAALDAVPNLIYLIKYSVALTAAACVREALAYLPSAPRQVSRGRFTVLLGWAAAVAGLTTAWLLAPVHERHVPGHFSETYATTPELIPFWAITLGYLGFMLVDLCRSQLTYRALPPSPIRTGMLTVGFGAAVGLVYVEHKALYLAVALTAGADAAAKVDVFGISAVLFASCVLLLLAGALWPVLAKLRVWWDNVITYYALEPLWRLLTTAVPDVVLVDARTKTLSQRTEGRLVEIRDALSSLPHPTDSATLQAASAEQRAAVAVLARVSGRAEAPLVADRAAYQPGTDDDTAQLRQLSTTLARADRAEVGPFDRAARVITNVLAPANLVALSVLVVACAEAGVTQGLLWSLVTLLFAPGLPLAVIVIGVRQHWWSDRHVRVRGQRLVPLTTALLSILACLAVLNALGAPPDLSALVVAMTAGLLVTLAVTVVWKVSIHAAVAAGAAVVLATQLGDAFTLLAGAGVVAVGWSRCRLRDHSAAQVLAGTLLGATAAVILFSMRVA